MYLQNLSKNVLTECHWTGHLWLCNRFLDWKIELGKSDMLLYHEQWLHVICYHILSTKINSWSLFYSFYFWLFIFLFKIMILNFCSTHHSWVNWNFMRNSNFFNHKISIKMDSLLWYRNRCVYLYIHLQLKLINIFFKCNKYYQFS